MAKIVQLPANIIGKEDKERLESFGGHTISRGRATRWHWDSNANGDDVFEIYIGGPQGMLAASITRDREQDIFIAHGAAEQLIVTGALDHVLAELDTYFKHRAD